MYTVDTSVDRQTESLHFFHSYAVKDRVNLSNFSDNPPSNTPKPEDVISTVLPTEEDDAIIHDEFSILVARILCSHITYFKDTFADIVDRHIQHKYSQEMSQKSEVVSIVFIVSVIYFYTY